MTLPQGPHFGSMVWLCGHSGGGKSKIMRSKARERRAGAESWVALCVLLGNVNFLQW